MQTGTASIRFERPPRILQAASVVGPKEAEGPFGALFDEIDPDAKLNAEVMGSNTDPYYGAPVVILVLADGSANTFVEDGSCVLENMMLAAHALGLGTVWVHREREIFDSESGKALLREWKLPETLRGVGAIALGYPAQEAGHPAARKQNYIVRI